MIIEFKEKKFKKGDMISIFYRAKGERQLRESIGIVIEKVANMICIETEDGFKAVNVKTIVNIFKYEKKVECEFM
ncbi:MAG: hypothetical protein J6D47_14170 [Peptostreptococcaceae bacterium]|nr:hypothetical protein [Peptostreptococcaceae bacterium]